jgi:hypothetical protein
VLQWSRGSNHSGAATTANIPSTNGRGHVVLIWVWPNSYFKQTLSKYAQTNVDGLNNKLIQAKQYPFMCIKIWTLLIEFLVYPQILHKSSQIELPRDKILHYRNIKVIQNRNNDS